MSERDDAIRARAHADFARDKAEEEARQKAQRAHADRSEDYSRRDAETLIIDERIVFDDSAWEQWLHSLVGKDLGLTQ